MMCEALAAARTRVSTDVEINARIAALKAAAHTATAGHRKVLTRILFWQLQKRTNCTFLQVKHDRSGSS